MRLLLKLEALKSVEQNKENNSKYFTGMHGWIYNILKNSSFKELYENKDFKPFCFSNIYSIRDSKIIEGQSYNIIISSPNEFLIIELISDMQPRVAEEKKIIFNGTKINLGEYSFELIGFKPLPSVILKEGDVLESENLINITAHQKGKIAALTLEENAKLFKENLKKNLIRKYNYFLKENISETFNLFENIDITQIPKSEKSIKINLIKENSDNWFNVIGARYRFKLGKLNETQKKILQLCYDLGFGERNTFGFGFMNLKNSKKKDS